MIDFEEYSQHESTTAEPSDELYEALSEVLGLEEESTCHKSYFLVHITLFEDK